MSIFNDKALKGVAEAVAKIVEAEKMATKDHDKDGKIETGKAEYLGSRIRAARLAGNLKEDDVGYQDRYSVKNGKATVHNPAKGEKDEPHHVWADNADHAVRKHAAKTNTPVKEEVELDEAFPTVDDAKKRMNAGKTATGSVTKTKTGLVHKRDYSDDADDSPSRATKGYGARQNATNRGTSMGTSGGRKASAKKANPKFNEKDYQEGGAKHTGKMYKTESPSKRKMVLKHYDYLGKNMGESYSFTEMLELYNESGIEVINKIFPQTVKFGDTEVELIDANEVNGVVGITVAEEVDNETFTKEVEAQKEKNAGRGKKAEVAKASVQAVKQEEVEQIDEISKETAGKYLTAPQGKGANKYKVSADKASYPDYKTFTKHATNVRRALQRSGGQAIYKKPDYYKEETEQLDELSKSTLGSYIKAASHDVATKGALTRHFADKSRREKEEKKGWEADKSMKKADKTFAAGWKRRQNMAKAVDRLTKEEIQMDERTLTAAETSKKEEIVKSMKKGLSGFKARYGDRAKEVMYATATKQAKKD